MSVVTTIRTTLAAIALTAATVSATATLGSNEAEARRAVIRIGHIHHRHYHPRLHGTLYIAPFYAAGYFAPCQRLRSKAYHTGSPYWHARYEACLRD